MKLIIDEEIKKSRWNKKDKIIGIYSVTNTINGKKFIGKASDIRKRFSDYTGSLCLTDKRPLFVDIKDLGHDSFEFEVLVILEENDSDKLKELEKEYIEKFDTTNPEHGYNIGKGGKSSSEEVRAKMSESHKGLTESAETKKKKSNTIYLINPERKVFIISDSGKLAGDYFGKTKDYIKNCLRQPSSIDGFRLYYEDFTKRNIVLDKMNKKRSVRDKEYVRLSQYLNSLAFESVETIYESIKKDIGAIYKLSYDNDSVSLTGYVLSKDDTTFESFKKEDQEL